MPTVTVYRFTTYDGRADEKVISTRWGTLKGIHAIGGAPLTETAADVDASLVGSEIEGLTARGFDPYVECDASHPDRGGRGAVSQTHILPGDFDGSRARCGNLSRRIGC